MQGMKCKTASVDYIFIYYFFRLKKKRETEPESEKKKKKKEGKKAQFAALTVLRMLSSRLTSIDLRTSMAGRVVMMIGAGAGEAPGRGRVYCGGGWDRISTGYALCLNTPLTSLGITSWPTSTPSRESLNRTRVAALSALHLSKTSFQ